MPPTNPQKTRLCHATRTALAQAMKQARAGQPLNGIGAAIERTARTYGFKIIENLGSHGVGRALHEAPEFIPGYFDPADKRILKEGMVITIEPFLSTKSRVVSETDDGWTLGRRAGQPVGAVRAHDDHHEGRSDHRDAALSARQRQA
ncbi:MAG: M24 family metallopeptidase [Aquabacterium sp.]